MGYKLLVVAARTTANTNTHRVAAAAGAAGQGAGVGVFLHARKAVPRLARTLPQRQGLPMRRPLPSHSSHPMVHPELNQKQAWPAREHWAPFGIDEWGAVHRGTAGQSVGDTQARCGTGVVGCGFEPRQPGGPARAGQRNGSAQRRSRRAARTDVAGLGAVGAAARFLAGRGPRSARLVGQPPTPRPGEVGLVRMPAAWRVR